ncbi:hypothetical protein ACFVOR_34615 [Streptomyces sp. NPDC057837]|uniref:hypothetical protein n=1 Tax=Streptomyces sp. NPDC057837 TaxID=3346260 RepID=UPI00368FB6D3
MISLPIRPFGTSHGRHDGAQAKITAVRGDTRSEPCFWVCTCGTSCSFLTEDGVLATAWRHNHPTRFARLRQWATRRLQFRARGEAVATADGAGRARRRGSLNLPRLRNANNPEHPRAAPACGSRGGAGGGRHERSAR